MEEVWPSSECFYFSIILLIGLMTLTAVTTLSASTLSTVTLKAPTIHTFSKCLFYLFLFLSLIVKLAKRNKQ